MVYAFSGIAVELDLQARDVLLVFFFTTIGINASLSDLLAGGKPLSLLLLITIDYMALQNLTGITIASLFNLPGPILTILAIQFVVAIAVNLFLVFPGY